MQKFLALTTLNALDPLPGLGRKVETKPNPAPDAKAAAIEYFERTPHELSPGRFGQAGGSVADGRLTHDYFERARRSAQHATACAGRTLPELLRSFLPHGDQRPAGEGKGWYSHEGRHEADHCPDSGDARRRLQQLDFGQTEARVFGYLQSQSTETGRSSFAGPAVTWAPGWTRGLSRAQLSREYEQRMRAAAGPFARQVLTREYQQALAFAHP